MVSLIFENYCFTVLFDNDKLSKRNIVDGKLLTEKQRFG